MIESFFLAGLLEKTGKLNYLSDYEVKISQNGPEDGITVAGNQITIHKPTLLSKTLFNLSYALLSKDLPDQEKNYLSLFLWIEINEYLNKGTFSEKPPILRGGNEFLSTVLPINKIFQPITDQIIKLYPVLHMKCAYTDPCRIINSFSELSTITLENAVQTKLRSIPNSKYPLILCNNSVQNPAACESTIFIKQLELNFGEEKTQRILKHLLLNEFDILQAFVTILNICSIDGMLNYVEEFLQCIKRYVKLNDDEAEQCVQITTLVFNNIPFLSNKVAQYTNQSVEKQWMWWGTMVGLTEKQLGGNRHQRRDATENMKPIEDKLKEMIKIYEQKTGKKDLCIEDLLKVVREYDESKTIEPGRIYERLLGENRIWQ